ncbi:VRR-NUC domain-containing protein [Granulosicoccus antarcticus]|uniref:phosphodiesterase I n=1 Tax=Granulosicoccus antarcticus IMCC3135 TaxID=1192854 RepID=A0A2Z2NVD5_9GAMM|nr:VRR-NUC domain-containing protein [Granulosicoccus antarcticus]ASJ75436.1 hypothetical protein IMCC3135_26905 [Granulosicoccus antarcticus IMCC3135]
MQTGRPEALAENYYLANFHRLADFVVDTYRDILTPAERQWYDSLQASTESAQQLYIRLLSRKGSVFRLSRISYPEIESLDSAASELATRGLAETLPPDNLQILLSAFTKPELSALLIPGGKWPRSRVELIDELLAANAGEQARFSTILQQADEWITLYGHQHWSVFRLGYFGNLYQDSTEFVLQELGTVIYENYALDAPARPFATRSQLNAHLRYFECEALLDTISLKEVRPLLALVAQLPVMIAGDDHLLRRVDRLRNRIARQLERLGCQDDALELYAVSVHPPARERRVRLHLGRGELDHAGRLLSLMREAPFNDAEDQVADRLQQQYRKAAGLPAIKQVRFKPQTTALTLSESSDRVEYAARAFYGRLGDCYYTENALVNAVLGLFIWDIIYFPIAGAFFNPFQSAPADFYQPSFSARRANLLMTRFEELESESRFTDRVFEAYERHQGKSNPLVRWDQISLALLSHSLERIPVSHWRAMFQRILSDTRDNTSGFPDLILFREEAGYEFIEVKGPGDVLQKNQLRWMQYFDSHGIPCRVVNIRWAQDVIGKAGQ